MPSRSERIAALEAQLANSRRRRSQLLGSLGKESGGTGDAEYAEPHSPLSPLDREPARGLERSDLSASPGLGDSLGYGWTPAGRQNAELKKSSPQAGSASGGDDALRAELKQRTRQVSELQAKLAEATRKTEQAMHQALEDKAALAQLTSQKAERDRRIEVLEGAVAEEKRSVESCQGRIAELRQHGSVHEEAARKLRAELHKKTLDFDRIRDESRRQHSEELQRAKDGLRQSKAEIVELKSALSASQKKEGDLSQQLQTQEAALKELQNKEQSQVESLRQSKMQSSEHELRLEQTKSDLQFKIDKMQQQITLLSASNDDLRQKEQSLYESLRQCKKQNNEFQLKIDRLQMDTSVLGSTKGGLEKQLAEAERDAEQLRSKLHRAQLQLDSDETVIATLRADLSTLAGLDESLKAAATAETARSNDLQSQLFQMKQQLGHAQDQQARLQETGKLWQRQLEVLKDELQAEQETNRWLRKELEQKTRDMLARAASAKEPPEFLADTTRDMDASLQATERHIALVARLANQRGAELDQLRKELASAHDGRRVAEALKTAEVEKLRAELNRLKEEHRVTETSQITLRMVAESHLEYHKQILATARFQAATLHSDISNYLHAYNEVVTEVQTSEEAMYIEQLSLQRDLVACMHEIRENGKNAAEQHAMRERHANAIHYVRDQCSAIAFELSNILSCDDLSHHAAELGRAMLQHEQVTERLSSVLYASENSRQMLASKVEQLELSVVHLIDQNETLASKNKELETALGKCHRQYKFSQSQSETQIACLESAEAKVKQMEEEALRLTKLTEQTEKSREEAELLKEHLIACLESAEAKIKKMEEEALRRTKLTEQTEKSREEAEQQCSLLKEQLMACSESRSEEALRLTKLTEQTEKSRKEAELLKEHLIACLESAEAKIKQMEEEALRRTKWTEQTVEKSRKEAEQQCSLLKEQLKNSQNEWSGSLASLSEALHQLTQEMDEIRKAHIQMGTVVQPTHEHIAVQTDAENETAPRANEEMTAPFEDAAALFVATSATDAVTRSEQDRAHRLEQMEMEAHVLQAAKEQGFVAPIVDDCGTRRAMHAHFQITLDLEYRIAGEQGSEEREAFKLGLISDLATAAHASPAAFAIKSISPGSIVVDVQILRGVGVEPMAVVADLEQQAKVKNSPLCSGKLTNKVKALTATVPSTKLEVAEHPAECLRRQGKYVEAEEICEVLAVQNRVLGVEHCDTLITASKNPFSGLQLYDEQVRTLSEQLSDAQKQIKESEVHLSQAQAKVHQLLEKLEHHESVISDRDLLAIALEVKEGENAELSSQLNNARQELQGSVAWFASEKAVLQKQLDDALQKLETMEADWEKKLEKERRKTTELMGRLSSDAQGEGLQSHIQHLEKVSSDLEQLYLQTAEINAMKREIVDKNTSLNELETLVMDQFNHSSQEAKILETLLELSSLLSNCLISAQGSCLENRKIAEKSKLEATKSARAWQSERDERAKVLQALWDLSDREAERKPQSFADLTAEDAAAFISQLLKDRSIVMDKLAILTKQAYDAKQDVEERNKRIQTLLEDALGAEKMASAQRKRIDELEHVHRGQLQQYVSWSTRERSQLGESTTEMVAEMVELFERALEESTSLAQGIQGALERNLKEEVKAKDEAMESLAECESNLQAETQAKEEALRAFAELKQELAMMFEENETRKRMFESNLQAEAQAREEALRALAELKQEHEQARLQLDTMSGESETRERMFEEIETRLQGQEQTLMREQVLLKAELVQEQRQRKIAEQELAQAQAQVSKEQQQRETAEQKLAKVQAQVSKEQQQRKTAAWELAQVNAQAKEGLQTVSTVDTAVQHGLSIMQTVLASEEIERILEELKAAKAEILELRNLEGNYQQEDKMKLKEQSAQATLSAAQPSSECSPPVPSSGTVNQAAGIREESIQMRGRMEARDDHWSFQKVVSMLFSCEEELSAIKTSIEEQAVSVQTSIKSLQDRVEKEVAESEDLRSALADARSQAQNLRQELDEMRQGDADSVILGKVETLESEIAELQLQITTLQTKLDNDADYIESLKASQGAATARSAESEAKLLEAERTMLACVAEEARLIDEIEAGLNREQELEQRIKTLQGIRDPMHLPRTHLSAEVAQLCKLENHAKTPSADV